MMGAVTLEIHGSLVPFGPSAKRAGQHGWRTSPRGGLKMPSSGRSTRRWWSSSGLALSGVVLAVGVAACGGHKGEAAARRAQDSQLREVLAMGAAGPRAVEAPDPAQVVLPERGKATGWRPADRAAVVAFLRATAPMAGARTAERGSVCAHLGDPAGLKPVVEQADAALERLPAGEARLAVVNDFASKTRLSPGCAPDAAGWSDVAFTHVVAVRVVLEAL